MSEANQDSDAERQLPKSLGMGQGPGDLSQREMLKPEHSSQRQPDATYPLDDPPVQRGAVSLEEMTRRRDRWHRRAQMFEHQVSELIRDNKRLKRELEIAMQSVENLASLRAVLRQTQERLASAEAYRDAARLKLEQRDAEIERLRAQLRRQAADQLSQFGQDDETIAELRSEVDRLRAARREDHLTFAQQRQELEEEHRMQAEREVGG